MTFGSAYDAHDALVAPGRVKPQLWRLLLGLGLIAAVSYLLNTVVFVFLMRFTALPWQEHLVQGDTPAAMLVLLLTFGFLTLGAGLAARVLQWRSLLSVVGALGPLLWQFRAVSLALLITPMGSFWCCRPMILARRWCLIWGFGPGLACCRCLFWRCWCRSAPKRWCFAAICNRLWRPDLKAPSSGWWRLRRCLVWRITCLAEAADNAWLLCLWAMGFGLVTADLTARAGTLGPAIAVHFVNNIVALLIFASPSSLSGLALYLLPYELSDVAQLRPWLLVDCAMMLVSWLVARLAIRR